MTAVGFLEDSMLELDPINTVNSKELCEIPDILVFLGPILVFPNSILRIAEQEAGGVHSVRVGSVSELLLLAQNQNGSIKKVFVDDQLVKQTMNNFDTLCRDLPEVDWIFAYRDKGVARSLLAERNRSPHHAQILLLPMTLPICPWSSMLRLVLAGQFIAPGDLIGAAANDPQHAQSDNAVAANTGALPPPTHPPQQSGTGPNGTPATSPDPGLTRREKEVLELVSQGGRNKTIAHEMSLSEHTVKLHLHNAITKIGARNRTEAANWYLSRHIGGGA